MIYEVIVVTMDDNGQPHCAPMGITYSNDTVIIKPFKSSLSYDNLRMHQACSLNMSDDVRVFAGALTGDAPASFARCQHIKGYYLDNALTHAEVKIIDVDDKGNRANFTGKMLSTVNHAPFQGFNRAQAAVIEASILVSRLHLLPVAKIAQEMRYLNIAINKTGGARELEAWGWLVAKLTDAGIKI